MTYRPVVSVVVPTRNRASLLPGLLAALDQQDYPCYEVIVVDDGSSDATRDVLAAWTGEGHRTIRLDRSSGSYAARNAGWHTAGGEIIAFTDDDCLPTPGWLSALVAALDDGAAAVQGVTLPEPGEITPFTHQISQTRPGPPYRTCNMAYRRSVLEGLGGFDARFRWYADNILGIRAEREGEIAFAPDGIVLHPPRPREWRDRAHWRARFDADARHRQELRRLGAEPLQAPNRALPVLLWVLRPLARQSVAHLRYLVRHPIRYMRAIGPMLNEKSELLAAMREQYRPVVSPRSPAQALPPLPARPLVSVVIVTSGRDRLLCQTLEALNRQSWEPREVIVVDNSGRLEIEGARLLAAPGLGLGAARQMGVEAAQGEIIAFTDDDCLPDSSWLEELVAALRDDARLLGVQGVTLPDPGPIGSHTVRVSRPSRLYETCNIAYRRDALDLAAGFDVDFRLWFEDTALAARVLANGPIGFAPEARVMHQAVPRRSLGRAAWQILLEDERRLAERYPAFYHSTRGSSVLRAVIVRWLIGSPIKTILRELPRAGRNPAAFVALLFALASERATLLSVLLDMQKGRRLQRPSGPNGRA